MRTLAELLAAAPDRCGWRAGMDDGDYAELAEWLAEQGVTIQPPAEPSLLEARLRGVSMLARLVGDDLRLGGNS